MDIELDKLKEPPFRSEIFGADQLRYLGKELAQWQELGKNKKIKLLDRLEEFVNKN